MLTIMQDKRPKRLDVVALLEDRPGTGLKAGQVGTIVEFLGTGDATGPEAYEVEFCDKDGRTLAYAELRRSEFLVLLAIPEALAI